jgi:uncharacterized protein
MILRKLYSNLLPKLFKQKAIIVLGPRQVGKTTLVKYLGESYKNEMLYLNADLPTVRENLTNVGLEKMKSIIGNAKLVIIDEAQRIKDIGVTLKIIHDNLLDIQLIVTGSSALELANEVNEPMTGRKWEYYMYPISWQELTDSTNFLQAREQLETRLIFGMYPDVINNPGEEENILNQLASSYLYKDLLAFKGIRKPDVLEKLLKALAFQLGNEVSYNELAGLVGVDKITIEHYISLLEKAFVIFRLQPFARNLRKEINTSRKIYFYDNGIRNAIIANFSTLAMRNDIGALWENFIISERMKANHYNETTYNNYFWRNHAKQEIDYIEEKGGNLYAYEIKWNPKTKVKFPNSFEEAYAPILKTVIHNQNFEEFLK